MMLIAIIAALTLTQVPGQRSEPCPGPDAAMLALPLHDFDQTDAGWRSLDAKGCEALVADSIALYRDENASRLATEDTGTLDWHEGQLRAAAGQTDSAVSIMEAGLDATTDAIRPYREATIAFLKRDRVALEAARDRLMALPEPEYFAQSKARYEANYPDMPPLTWPLNQDKVDGFIACFDRSYSEAYVCDADGNVQP